MSSNVPATHGWIYIQNVSGYRNMPLVYFVPVWRKS